MSLAARLKALRTDRGMTQQEVADKLRPRYTSPAVRAWESGKANPRMDTLRQLAEMFDVSVAYLIGEDVAGAVTPSPSSVLVPVLGTAHMGSFDDLDELDYRVEVPSSVVEAHPDSFLIRGFGDCMNRRYPEDAFLLIDKRMEPKSGDAVLVQSDDGSTLVRVYSRGSSTLMLSPDSYSESYSDILGSPDKPPVTIVGVVVWYQASKDVRRL